MALLGPHIVQCQPHGFFRAHQHQQLAGAGDGGVEQIALQHDGVLGGERQHDGGVFGALGFVHGDGVTQGKRVQLGQGVGVPVEDQVVRRELLCTVGPKGKQYLPVESIFVRADGMVTISGNGMVGPLRHHLSPEERSMVQHWLDNGAIVPEFAGDHD